jgi:predicted transcriptional regulator
MSIYFYINVKVRLINEGNARQASAQMNITCMENFAIAINLYSEARKILTITSRDYALALMNEANARSRLAEKGYESKKNLETAIRFYNISRKIFPKKSEDYASSLINEGNVRLQLAKMGLTIRENLENAISLNIDARRLLHKESTDYALSLMNENTAWSKLAELDIVHNENFVRLRNLLFESISILDRLGYGWVYSLALLNLNVLLKGNFYKTGDREYLKEWEDNLSEIEDKIKDRDIVYKEILVASIHDIRASLFELDGKQGLYNASLEYDKAYEILKIPYFKFMNEFCQARIDTKSFCELVSAWKEVEKEGIFLDYYDYTVFECHMENSLKSTINEEDELKHAVKKLTEIRDRTRIKIIKDRVSAYIHLLQALVDCFNKGSYHEAAENVNEGCKIFCEYGDKQGQQMCETFHNVIVKNRDHNAWYDIIRNREFSSNFYNLLCEYSDRKKADLEYFRFGQMTAEMNTIHSKVDMISGDIIQVKETSIRTENKVDNIQNSLGQIHSGIVEIKDQIEEGFDGTAKELREIKGEVNKIEKYLETLVQSSKDVDGKEGECIRQFATKMLELMKKGDYEALKHFIEKINENEASLKEIIEKSEAPEQEKADAKSRLADLKKIPGVLKEKAKSFGKDVAKDVVVTLTAEEIVKLLVPVLSTAVFGVPIPSKIVEILFSAIRSL